MIGSALAWLFGGALFRPVATFGTSIVIVAGPWLLSILTLAIISQSTEPILGRQIVEDLRLTIIYSLLIAPLIAGPIGAVSSRLVRDATDQSEAGRVPGIVLLSLIVSGGLTMVVAILVCLALGIANMEIAMAFIFLSVSTSLLWNCLAVLSALRAYSFMIGAFAAGMLVCTGFALVAGLGLGPQVLIWAFACGIAFCVALILARLVESHEQSEGELGQIAASMLREFSRSRYLILGILFSFFGIWADKLVLWLGPEGERSVSGFLHYGSYDSVMFLAHLSIIPSFAAMHLLHDRAITNAAHAFRASLSRHANLNLMRASVTSLGNQVWNGVLFILFVQGTITATLVLVAPILSKFMHFDFAQFLTLRVGLIAVFVHAIYYMSSAVLVLCGRHRQFFAVQLIFFLANLFASSVFMVQIGPSAYGIFVASLVAAIVSFLLAYQALQRYDYLALVGENDSLFRDLT